MQVVSEEFLCLGVDKPSDISDNQLILLDIALDKKELWFELALGKNISDARAELFVLLKGISAKTNQDKIIKNYKVLQQFREAKRTLDKQAVVVSEIDVSLVKSDGEISPIETVSSRPQENDTKIDTSDVTIYCDGGCSPNPGKCGSGIAVYRAGKVSELWYGLYEIMGTNNTAELNALYHSLLIAQKESASGKNVVIRCDSMYSINCVQTWAIGWEKNGWKKKGGEIKNLEIIQKAYALYNQVKAKIELSHIKAHAGLEGNELADRMTVYTRDMKEPAFVQYDKTINVDEILSMRAG